MTCRSYSRHGCGGRRTGFTLIELLLVIIIITVVTAVSVPSFVKSMHGNRRRTAARTVVAAGRYARSMAVLHQRPIGITFDLDASTLLISEFKARPLPDEDAEDEDSEASEDASPLSGAFAAEREERTAVPGAAAGVSVRLERKLDQVSIAYVHVGGEAAYQEGSCTVVYQSNGRCAPYEVRIVDGQEEGIVIKVDALASALTQGDGE